MEEVEHCNLDLMDDTYEMTTYSDGSKKLTCPKNKKGFKITIKVSGDKERHQEAIEAVRDFYVKGLNL